MQHTNLLENLEFHDEHPYAQPLYVDSHGRVLRFMLQPGQSIREHDVPDSPFYVVVLAGHGRLSDSTGEEVEVGPHSLLLFDPGESHTVQAGDEELIFVGFLHGVPGTRPQHIGGEMGRQ